LPKWINEDAVPRNLAKLNLRSTRLSYDVAMKALGVLPNLVILRLWRNAFEGKDLEVEFSQDTFPRLNRLEIANLDNLKFIKFRANTVVELEVIQVNYCQIFDEGGFSGIDFLGSLKEVVLKGEYEEEFKAALQAKVTNATLIMSDN
jgi:disease resistance protein RPM1